MGEPPSKTVVMAPLVAAGLIGAGALSTGEFATQQSIGAYRVQVPRVLTHPPPSTASPPVMAGLIGSGALCLVTGFPATNLVDETPLAGAGARTLPMLPSSTNDCDLLKRVAALFAGASGFLATMAPKNPAMMGAAAACAGGAIASLHFLGMSGDDVKASVSMVSLLCFYLSGPISMLPSRRNVVVMEFAVPGPGR
jgi:hypothetical protein